MRRSGLLALVLLALTCLLTGCVSDPASTEGAPTASAQTTAATQVPPAPPVSSALKLWCFQAGKADAFLLWNESGAILIDTGESGFGKVILQKLSELGVRRLDALIVTHFDKDHVGGAKKLLSAIPVERVLQSNCPKPGADAYENYLAALAEQGLEPLTVRTAATLTLGDAVLTVDPPAQARYLEDASNNSSLIVTVQHGQNRLLFCGDAEELRLSEFLSRDPGLCAVVKLPHHGRYQATLQKLLTATRPTWAIITSSDEEPEDAETLQLLEQTGVQALCTRAAPIQIVSDGSTLSVQFAQQ